MASVGSKWGEDEIAARAACLEVAAMLADDDGVPEMGADLECRQFFCDGAAADETLCASAMGAAVCI